MAEGAENRYRIRVRRGHNRKLRFWFAPVSDKIMNADADWLEDAELSCDNLAAKQLFFPFIQKYYPGEFEWRNELNLMPFENVRAMTKEVRKVVKLMRKNYADPRLARYKRHFSIDLVVDSEEYEEKYAEAPDFVREKGIEENKEVICEFYLTLSNWLDKTMDKYEPLGFRHIAIFAPH